MLTQKLFAISVLGFLLLSPTASAQSSEEVLGAIAGGALGSTIGDGDGRKAATVLGAIIGYRYGEQILNGSSDKYYEYPRYRHDRNFRNRYDYEERSMMSFCKSKVPQKYTINSDVERSWIRGCVSHMQQKQAELEAEAFNDGAGYGPSN